MAPCYHCVYKYDLHHMWTNYRKPGLTLSLMLINQAGSKGDNSNSDKGVCHYDGRCVFLLLIVI